MRENRILKSNVPHIDYRKSFKECDIDMNMLCNVCGDIYVTDLDQDGKVCMSCHGCGKTKYE